MTAKKPTGTVARLSRQIAALSRANEELRALLARLGETAAPAQKVAYADLVRRVRTSIDAVAAGSTVLVVSKGDADLLELSQARGWHFPRTARGEYAGHHPVDSATAIAQLEALAEQGAEFLALPRTAFWWLEHYAGFRRHLEERYRLVLRTDDCVIFSLSAGLSGFAAPAGPTVEGFDPMSRDAHELVDAFVPHRGAVIVAGRPWAGPLIANNRRLWSLPQPAPTADAPRVAEADLVDQIAALRQMGASFLVVPSPVLPWFQEYERLVRELDTNYSAVERQGVCRIYGLGIPAISRGPQWYRVSAHRFVRRP